MIKNGDSIYNGSVHSLKNYAYGSYSSKDETKASKINAKQPTPEETRKKTEKTVTQILASAAAPNRANRPYGSGETIASTEVAYAKVGKVDVGNDQGRFVGETALLEARARTYKTKTGVGAEAQASLIRSEYGGKGSTTLVRYGRSEIVGVGAYGKGEFFAGAQADAQAGAGMKGIVPFAGASVAAFAGARVTLEGGAELRLAGIGVRVDAEGHAWAGAQGSAEASVSPAGIEVGVEGFAGAEAGGSVTGSIRGIGVRAEGDAYAGAGGKAGFGIGLTDDGDIVVRASAGGALGVGAGGEIEVSIDVDRVIEDGENFLNTASEVGGDLLDAAGDVVEQGAEAVSEGAEAVGNVVSEGTEAVSDGVDTVAGWFGL